MRPWETLTQSPHWEEPEVQAKWPPHPFSFSFAENLKVLNSQTKSSHTHPTLLLPPREDKSKSLGAEAKEDEYDQPHPGIEQSKHWIEVWHLLAWELDVGWVSECPDHAEQEVSDGQTLALHLEILHHILLPSLRCA